MEKNNEMLAKRLKELCKEKSISYRELAEKAGVPESRIARIAYGGTSNPGVFTMIKICEGLETTLDEFFEIGNHGKE